MKLTQKWVNALEATDQRQSFRDDEQAGFGLRCEPAASGGRKTYFWNAKVGGQVYYRALGETSTVSVKDARYSASVLAGKARDWKQGGCIASENPFAEKPGAVPTAVPAFRALVEHYVKNHLHNPASEINHPDKAEKNLRWSLKKFFGGWMDKPVDTITVDDAVKLRDAAKDTPYAANRNVQLARALLAYCSGGKDGKVNVWELPSNVAARVELFPENERERYLSPEEQKTLEDALKDAPRDLADFVLLSLSSGARKMSLLLAEWTEFDFELRQWTIPAEHSKSGRSYIVDLMPDAIEILERRRESRTTHPFVFPPVSGTYLHLDKPFQRLVKRIGGSLIDVHIHDLRRTMGATMACNGASLEQIAKALGQESVDATGVYARLSRASVRKAREDAHFVRREQMAEAGKRMASQKHVANIRQMAGSR
jgi:integrase